MFWLQSWVWLNNCPFILRGREMVTHRPHKPEIPGPNPGLPQPYRRIQQSFSFENSLAHLVEHLSVKQSVIGSSPIIILLMRLVYGSVAQLVEAVGWSPTRRWFKSIQAHQLQGLIRSIIFCNRVKAEWNPFPYISEIYGTKNYYLWGVFYTRLF